MFRNWLPRSQRPPQRKRHHPRIEILEDRICPVTIPGDGSIVSFSAGNVNPGDKITLTAIITATDSDEAGSDETLDITGGPFSTTIADYNIAHVFTITIDPTIGATGDFQATVNGGDGDETGDVSLQVNSPGKLSPLLKDALAKRAADLALAADAYATADAGIGFIGTGSSLVPGGQVAAGDNILSGVGPLGLLSGLEWTESAILQRLVLDPPDPNYQSIASPEAIPPFYFFSNSPLTQAQMNVVADFNSLFANETQVIGVAEALYVSVNRFSGARQAGDTFWQQQQSNAIHQYELQLADLEAQQPALHGSLQADLQAAGITIYVGPDALSSLESTDLSTGLPADVTQVINLIGDQSDIPIDQSDLAYATSVAYVQNPSLVAGDLVADFTNPTVLTNQQSLVLALRTDFVLPTYARGADPGQLPEVKVFNADGSVRFDFLAYSPTFTGGVNVAVGDINGDGIPEIVTVPASTGPAEVRTFDGRTGVLLRDFFAFPANFAGGFNVAVGDLNYDGFGDIVVSMASGLPWVRSFSGTDYSAQFNFFPFSVAVTGGVRIAVGDVNGDGFADLIVAPGPGSLPEVKIYSGHGEAPLNDFIAFAPSFLGGVFLAAGDTNGSGMAQVIVGAGSGPPLVAVFSGTSGSNLKTFFAFSASFNGGVRVAASEISGDGRADILTTPGPGASSEVKAFDTLSLAVLDDFFASSPFAGVSIGGR